MSKSTTKKPGGNSTNIVLPVEVTLERGTTWTDGARPLVSPEDVRKEADRPRKVFPPRARQNASTLAIPGLGTHALVELLGHNGHWDAFAPFGALRVAAPEVFTDALAIRTQHNTTTTATLTAPSKTTTAHETATVSTPVRDVRYVTSNLGSIAANPTATAQAFEEFNSNVPSMPAMTANVHPSAAVRSSALYTMDWARRKLAYFANDSLLPSSQEPYGMTPDKYPPMRLLKQKYQPRMDEYDALMADSSERYPRVIVEIATKAQRRAACRRPKNGRRECVNMYGCECYVLAMQQGRKDDAYVGREFLLQSGESKWHDNRAKGLPINEVNDGPVGRCLHCLDKYYTERVYDNMQYKVPIIEPFNIYQVMCVVGEYAPEYMLKRKNNGIPTGVEGNVPRYLTTKRHYETITLSDGQTEVCLVEVGMDFQSSLSKANTCIGAFKSDPFAGTQRFVKPTNKHVFLLRRPLEEAAGNAHLWVRFVRNSHMPMIVDRHMLMALESDNCIFAVAPPTTVGHSGMVEEREYNSRVPVAWLRLNLVHFGKSPIQKNTNNDEMDIETPYPFLRRLPNLTISARLDGCRENIVRHMTPNTIHHLQELMSVSSVDELLVFLTLMLDMTFSSYERSVSMWIEAVRGNDKQLAHLALFPLALMFWPQENAPHDKWSMLRKEIVSMWFPDAIQNVRKQHRYTNTTSIYALYQAIMQDEKQTFVLIAVALWRYMVAVFLEHYVEWPGNAKWKIEMAYQLCLFRSSHLDMLTHASRFRRFDDEHWFTNAPNKPLLKTENGVSPILQVLPWLAVMYPQASRIICGEELADLALAIIASSPWYDTGNKKALETIFQILIHIFICKMLNQSCQRRGFYAILDRGSKKCAPIEKLLDNIILCMMLGNVRGEVDPVPLVTAIRIRAMFAPHATFMETSSLKKFMAQKHLTLRSLLIGFYVGYTIECEPTMRRILYGSKKFVRYVTFIRHANAMWRREFTQQTAEKGMNAPINWDNIEYVTIKKRNPKTGNISYFRSGHMMTIHERTLNVFTKLKKGRFEEILLKKMTAIEETLNIDNAEMTKRMHENGRIDAIILVSWVQAKRSGSPSSSLRDIITFQTFWFKYFGMSEIGLDWLREWQFRYHEYDTRDDNLKKKTKMLYDHCPLDYVILKTFCRLFDYYRTNQVFFLPEHETRLQIQALRSALGIESKSAPPPLLGKGYFCEGCLTWADSICTVHPVLTGDLRATREALNNLIKGETEVPSGSNLAEQLAFGTNANDGQVVGLRAAFVNPMDTHLYCRRGRSALLRASETKKETLATTPVLGFEDDDDVDDAADDDAHAGRSDAIQDPYAQLAETVDNQNWAIQHGARLAAMMQPVIPPPPVTKKQEKKKKGKKRTVKDISRVVLIGTRYSCKNKLMIRDLVGAHWRVRNRSYGLCWVCGIKIEVHDTNGGHNGTDCGKHIRIAEYPDYHRRWLALGIPRSLAESTLNPVRLNLGPCIACRTQEAVRTINVHDFMMKRTRFPLCQYHVNCCRPLIPHANGRFGHRTSTGILSAPSIRIDHIMEMAVSFPVYGAAVADH